MANPIPNASAPDSVDVVEGKTVVAASGGARIPDVDLRKEAGGDSPRSRTFLDEVGRNLAFTVLLAMIGITILIGWDWWQRGPDAPDVTKGVCASIAAPAAGGTVAGTPVTAATPVAATGLAATDACRELIDTFRSLSDQADKRATTAFDSVVVKVFFPLMTALLGYLFATRSGKA